MSFLKSKYERILALVLIGQAIGLYSLSHGENIPLPRPLSEFPRTVDGWSMAQEGVVDEETRSVLSADDLLIRAYVEPSTRRSAVLFVAYFKSQRTGQTPHSPRNCLPGTGWIPVESGVVPISVPGEPQPIRVNRYVVSKGDDSSIVMYWYQTNRRIIASEYKAKIYSVVDAIRYNRTDTALVRVTVPVSGDTTAAVDIAIRFVQAFFGPLRHYLPS
jgi:EpsI family protein